MRLEVALWVSIAGGLARAAAATGPSPASWAWSHRGDVRARVEVPGKTSVCRDVLHTLAKSTSLSLCRLGVEVCDEKAECCSLAKEGCDDRGKPAEIIVAQHGNSRDILQLNLSPPPPLRELVIICSLRPSLYIPGWGARISVTETERRGLGLGLGGVGETFA